jgi:putative ABC transport system ATP-binding protein
MAGSPAALRTTALTKTYGEGEAAVQALRGVDFEVAAGEFVAVMGPSGSGKSTLLHIIGAMDTATSGEVEIGGEALSGLDDDGLTRIRRDRIGFVFQFFNLLGNLTALENVMLPGLISGSSASQLKARATELLGVVGLGDRTTHLPSQLSGGEQQRVSIARALMRDPEVIFADEPTGKLDTNTATSVLDLFNSLHADHGHTILIVTHDPVAASRAGRVVFLRDGQIAGEVDGGNSQAIIDFFSSIDGREA